MATTPAPQQVRDALAKEERSQAWLSRRPNITVHPQTVWTWCAGVARPSMKHRIAIEKLLGVPRDAWLTPDELGETPAQDAA